MLPCLVLFVQFGWPEEGSCRWFRWIWNEQSYRRNVSDTNQTENLRSGFSRASVAVVFLDSPVSSACLSCCWFLDIDSMVVHLQQVPCCPGWCGDYGSSEMVNDMTTSTIITKIISKKNDSYFSRSMCWSCVSSSLPSKSCRQAFCRRYCYVHYCYDNSSNDNIVGEEGWSSSRTCLCGWITNDDIKSIRCNQTAGPQLYRSTKTAEVTNENELQQFKTTLHQCGNSILKVCVWSTFIAERPIASTMVLVMAVEVGNGKKLKSTVVARRISLMLYQRLR